MIVGFTGTQEGMTYAQVLRVYTLLRELRPVEKLHHGDCIGADEMAHAIAVNYYIPVKIHPPIKSDKRAYCGGWTEMAEEKDYLSRNRDIVDESEFIVATPKEYEEQQRGGTWYTVRYAKKQNKQVFVIYPDGSHDHYFPEEG